MTHSQRYRRDIEIEDLLLWTYQVQRAHLVIDRGVGMHPLERMADGHAVQSSSSLTAFAAIEMLGVRVDGGGTASADLHPDAEAAAEEVKRLSPLKRGLVEHFGKTGEVPGWVPGGVRVEAVIIKDRPVVVYEDQQTKRKPLYCLVTDNADEVIHRRDTYQHWWDALDALARHLGPKIMTSFTVLPPRSERMPWTKGR
ncbi:MAG: hypothetical protein HQL41_05950 [Alphaproteobacteria bacterium]|nr:hypothetical protein [Alphaproteobacteria bacterium]